MPGRRDTDNQDQALDIVEVDEDAEALSPHCEGGMSGWCGRARSRV